MQPARLLALLAATSLSGCASALTGTHKSVLVTSDPPRALVRLDGTTRGLTPTVLHPSTRSDHTVEVVLAGYAPQVTKLVRRHSDWAWGNVATGLAPGIAFDAATGAIYRFEPGSIHAELSPLDSSAARRAR